MEKLLKGKTILVVDDEPDLREVIALEFQLAGAETAEAPNGNEAFALLQSRAFDVVVSDIRMPNGDGISLLDRIKLKNVDCPIVLLITGFSDITTDAAYACGAEGLFIKPFDRKEIVRTINHLTLPKSKRWALETIKPGPRGELSRNLPELQTALQNGEIRLGRGGFFIRGMKERLVPDDLVSFCVAFSGSEPLKLEGTGIVRWTRQNPSGELPAGYGIEFETLKADFRETFIKCIESLKPTCFIPNK
jgi:CheY-like chemotaxis protein